MAEYDRAAEDVGNIVSLEHVNVQIPDQQLSTIFYVMGLGLTRDPYQVVGVSNMWVNAGRCQFHLPTGKPQVVSGHTAVVMPGRANLLKRLDSVRKLLEGTRFSFAERNDHVETTCPWGNRIRVFEPGPRFGQMQLGMPYVEINVARGNADGIARFYREVFAAPGHASPTSRRAAPPASGSAPTSGWCSARRTAPTPSSMAITSRSTSRTSPARTGSCLAHKLISRETNQHEYRFIDIADLDTGKVLARLEHEVRSMTHPSYARPLVNRHPDAVGAGFSQGNEGMSWALPGYARMQ